MHSRNFGVEERTKKEKIQSRKKKTQSSAPITGRRPGESAALKPLISRKQRKKILEAVLQQSYLHIWFTTATFNYLFFICLVIIFFFAWNDVDS